MLQHDVRQAWRALWRTPVITATAILTLALGVGASTAVFSVVHTVLLRPLPYTQADSLVEFFEENRNASFRVSALNYQSWAERSQSFEAIAAFGNTAVTLTDDADPELVSGSLVTASLFRVLAVAPIMGRTLQPEDEERNTSRVVVLSEPLWRRRFGGDERIVGRSITLDGQQYQVVGVMPPTFREVGRAQATAATGGQLFLPLVIDRTQENRANHTLRVVGRLGRGVALEQARAEMRAVAAGLEREFPASNANWGVRIERLSDTTVEPQVHRSLLLMLGAVTIVFLIACANVANLMLTRGTHRRTELALRTALGAGRSRLIRQLLAESSCLALMSGVAGVLVAVLTHPLVRALLPPTLPRLEEMRLDVNVLAFGLLMTCVSALVSGIVPAIRASRQDLAQSLLLAGRATTDASRARLRQILISAQVALATTLLVSAALLVQGFVRLQRVPLGFEANDVLTARLSLPRSSYADTEQTRQFYDRLIDSVQASTHVRSAALATSAPFAPGVRASFQEHAAEHIVSGDYFRVLGIPLLSGRFFHQQDTSGAATVAIVSQRLARLLWPDANPLAQTIARGGRSYEVVGIVGDVRGSDTQGTRGGGPDRAPRAAIYFAAGQLPQRTMTVLVGASGESSGAATAIRAAVRELDPMLPVQQVRPLREWLGESVAPMRLTTTLATIFAISALLLASVGIYGVLAYAVAMRTREIGVRMAIGASRQRVIALVLRDGMTWVGGGIVAGLIGALATTSIISTLAFDVAADDPITFATAGAAVSLVALCASAIPAARAVHIDPAIAMRTD